MKKIVYLFIIVMAVFSCNKEDAAPSTPGYFILTELKSPTLKNALVDSVKTQFLLGDVKASKEFYFILSNGGDEPIFDVEFKSDNPAFQLFPEKIDELAGAKTVNNMIPLIALNVIHGLQLNGVGYSNLLPMNSNASTVTITGKILQDGVAIEIKSTFSFKVNALMMDINLLKDNVPMDITQHSMSVSSNLGGLGFVRLYQVSTGNISLQNSGNVDINASSYTQNNLGLMIKGQTVPLSKGSSLPLQLKNGLTIIELDSDGTITNDERIQLGNNGNGYFGFYNDRADTLRY
jgi:hypothetical protein